MQGALAEGWWPIAFMIMFASLLAVIYVWRVVEVMYFQKPADGDLSYNEAPIAMLIPTYVLIGAAVYFGTDATLTSEISLNAAQTLLGGSK